MTMKKAGIMTLLMIFMSIISINKVSAQDDHRQYQRDDYHHNMDNRNRYDHRRVGENNFHKESTYYGYKRSRHDRMRNDYNQQREHINLRGNEHSDYRRNDGDIQRTYDHNR
jgi:hypothetical protein